MPPPDQVAPRVASLASPGEDWFRREVHPHGGELKAYLHGSFPAVTDVDDVVQESFFRLWKRQQLRPIQSVKAFLYRVARNIVLDGMRRRRAGLSVVSLDEVVVGVEQDSPAEALTRQEKMQFLADAVMSLPERCREVVLLRRVDRLSQKQVAAQLGISERTVETHLRTGMGRCEQYLRRHGVHGVFNDEC